MRTTMIGRCAVLLLLLSAILAAPAVPAFTDAGFAAVVAQDDDEGEGDDGNDGPGKGDDKEEKEREKEEKRQEKDERKDNKPDKKEKPNPVEPAAGYGADVTCTVAADATSTECRFTSVTPAGSKKTSHFVIPEGVVCAGVLDGDFERVAPDPNTNVTGYRATGKEPFRLVLDGAVTTGGTATYWLKAADAVFPATGPGLACTEPAASTTGAALETTFEVMDETAVASTPAAVTTGTITVSTYKCAEVPADTSAHDWYGACDPGGDHRYVLAPAEGDGTDLYAAETAKTGAATFGDLAPGLYELEDTDGRWCHAESDAVNAEGQVMVEAGGETTVWLFYCDDGSGVQARPDPTSTR